ncbi:MAG: glucan biosynthesis protein D, partial [Alteromonas sp.]|nr:glucan biosynthesis protein D [Alteromonas sp.]
MAKPVSIFGKDLQTNVRQRNKLSHFLLTMSSVITLFAFQQAGAVEVNNDNQPQKASPVLQSIIDAARQSATE